VATFLDKTLGEEELAKLTEHLKFDNFKTNESVNNESGKKTGAFNQEGNFIRKGMEQTMNRGSKYLLVILLH